MVSTVWDRRACPDVALTLPRALPPWRLATTSGVVDFPPRQRLSHDPREAVGAAPGEVCTTNSMAWTIGLCPTRSRWRVGASATAFIVEYNTLSPRVGQ